MKNTLIILGVICLLVVAFLAYSNLVPRAQAPEEIPKTENGNGSESKRVVNEAFGFSYSYRSGADGYAVVTPESAVRKDLVFSQSIMDKDDYDDLLSSDIPRESPIALTLQVYRNPMNLEAREWITSTDASNYSLSADGTITEEQLGSGTYLRYQFDGLYRADAYVIGREGYIYLFTNMWDNPESNMKKDMEELIAGITWSIPTLPAVVAHGDIKVDTPKPYGEITSPLTVEGEARGGWFFEASFPVTLTDWDGRIIAESYAQAEGEWMTEEFVPFKGELTFKTPVGENRNGFLILQKDNPSGLPQHDDAIEIPVTFKE
jgi:hypothetical protein